MLEMEQDVAAEIAVATEPFDLLRRPAAAVFLEDMLNMLSVARREQNPRPALCGAHS